MRKFIWLGAAAVLGAIWWSSAQAPEVDPGPQVAPPKTRPRVAHIGDSLTSSTVDDLARAYAEVGLDVEIDAHGARAILQKLASDPKTGKQAAVDFAKKGGFDVYVIALGTNDTANVAVGASYTRDQAIDALMSALPSGARVLWVDTVTKMSTGPYQNANMVLWNQALDRAKARWPSLVVMPWSKSAMSAPFSDGIHHTTAGYAIRDRAIAKAVAALLP